MQDDRPNPLKPIHSFQPGRDDKPPMPTPAPTATKKTHWPPAFWTNWSRRTKTLVSLVIVLVLIGGGLGVWKLTHKSVNPIASPTTLKQKASTTVASPLTALQTDPALAKRPVTAIMIENSLDARPQSGLAQAGVVFEAIAEGGVTRFMALYQESAPQYIGPVRSLRPYYLHFASAYQASIVHVGGSPDALAEVSSGSYRNLDEFANGGYFQRIGSRDAPHNVYTSFDQLDKLNASKGYTSSSFTPWPRKADAKLATPTAKTIDFPMSGPLYAAHFDYDPNHNDYIRSEDGAYHFSTNSETDKTGQPITPKVVIAVQMSLTQGALDSSGAYYSDYQDTGSGPVYIFQDGGLTQGTWIKGGGSDLFSFKDAAGNTIKLDAGQTWVTAVTAGQVSYAP